MHKTLRPGSTIALVAPAGRVHQQELESSIHWLQTLGFNTLAGEHLYDDFFLGYHFAGKAENRLKDLQWAFSNDAVDAIFCARGGYGCAQLLDLLDVSELKQKPKRLVGYSDVTALHQFLQKHEISSVHGVTLKPLKTHYSQATYDSLQQIFFGDDLYYAWETSHQNREGAVKGRLVGGNLSILYSLVGTKYNAVQPGDVLFVEDWNENWYALDRMLTSMRLAGYFDGLKAIVLGNFTKMDDKNENTDFESPFDPLSYKIIDKCLAPLEIPIAYGFPAGHTGDNRALILGQEVELKIEKHQSEMKFLY